MEDIPHAERIPFGQRLKRIGRLMLEGSLGCVGPGSLWAERETVRRLELEMQEGLELPPTDGPDD